MRHNTLQVRPCSFPTYDLLNDLCCVEAENGLSFMETSALEARNVEDAFQSILTGTPIIVIMVYIPGLNFAASRYFPDCLK